jgi:hypothetical protein
MGIKFDGALTGFNTNFRHKGKVFHLQTEDSGEGHPHIITHVFVDGHIVATRKTPYEEHVGKDDIKDIVRSMMREQHKAMALAIRDGTFDDEKPRAREIKEGESADEKRRKNRLRGISGVYRTVNRREGTPPPPPKTSADTGTPAPRAAVGRRVSRDHVPGRLMRARESTRRQDPAFGEELLTDKTLEEVIASYLSDDLMKS